MWNRFKRPEKVELKNNKPNDSEEVDGCAAIYASPKSRSCFEGMASSFLKIGVFVCGKEHCILPTQFYTYKDNC